MAGTATVVGAVGTAVNVGKSMFGDDGSEQAGEYYGQSAALTQAQADLAREQLKQAQEQWDYWKQLFLPVQRQLSADQLSTYLPFQRAQVEQYQNLFMPYENQLFQQAMEGIKPDYEGVMGRASADVAQAFDKNLEASNRNMMRYGINPNSGRFVNMNRGLSIAESAADAGARTMAYEREKKRVEDTNWNRQLGLYQAKRGVGTGAMPTDMSGNAMGLMNSASSGLNTAAGNYLGLGNTAYNMGMNSAYGQGMAWNQLGNSMGKIGGMFGGNNSWIPWGSGYSGGGVGSNSSYYGSGSDWLTGGGGGFSGGSFGGGDFNASDYFPSFAKGGHVQAGQVVNAAEEGPEVFVPEGQEQPPSMPHKGLSHDPRLMQEAVDEAFQDVYKDQGQGMMSNGMSMGMSNEMAGSTGNSGMMGGMMSHQEGMQYDTSGSVANAIENIAQIYDQVYQRTGDPGAASDIATDQFTQLLSDVGPDAINQALGQMGPQWWKWVDQVVQPEEPSNPKNSAQPRQPSNPPEPQGPQVIGQNGPQLFVPPTDGVIIPNPATQQRMRMGMAS